MDPGLAQADEETSSRSVLSVEEFRERVAAACKDDRVLLIFDQFEELVTLFDQADAGNAQWRLVAVIVEMLRGALPVKILLSFREDYLGKVKELLSQCPELVDQALRLAPPKADALATIIRGPFDRYPGHFERELSLSLARRLVSVLAERFGAGDVSLSEVQTVCLRLWHSENPGVLLAKKGPQGLLEDYLGEALANLPSELRSAAIALLGQMITAAGTRNVISAQNLTERAREDENDLSPAVLEHALARLSQSRLVRRERRRDLYLYEIASEFLVPWISQRRAELRRQEDRRRERRRLVIFGSIAAALLLLAAGVTVLALWALTERSHARSEATTAASEARTALLTVAAQQNLRSRLDVALQLSLAALESSQVSLPVPPETRSIVIDSLEAARRSGLQWIVRGGNGPVNNVAFSPRGHTLAAASGIGAPTSDGGALTLWDVTTHRELGSPLRVTLNPPTAVAFSPDGRILASDNGAITLWDVEAHTPRPSPPPTSQGSIGFATASPASNFSPSADAVTFSPSGRTLAYVDGGSMIRLWDVASREPSHPSVLIPGARVAGSAIFSIAFSPNGRILASGGDHGVTLWNVATGQHVGRTMTAPNDTVTSVAFSPDGRTLAAGGLDDTVRFWNLATHSQLGKPLTGASGPVSSVAFAPNGRTIVSGSADGTVRLWNVTTRRELGAPLIGAATVTSVAFSPDGGSIAAGGDDGSIREWATRTPLGSPLRDQPDAAGAIAFTSGGRTLASANCDNTVTPFDVASQKPLSPTPDKRTRCDIALSPSGTTLASVGADHHLRVWDMATGKQLGALRPAHTSDQDTLAFSPDGRTLAIGSDDGLIRLRDMATSKQRVSPLAGLGGAASAIALSANDDILGALSATSADFELWDLKTHQRLNTPLTGPNNDNGTNAIAFSPRGTVMAAGGLYDSIALWNGATRRITSFTVPSHTNALAFSPDGSILVSIGADNTLRLWDVATHLQLGSALRAPNNVDSLTFSPDGTLLATISTDKTIRLWSGFLWSNFAQLTTLVCMITSPALNRGQWAQYAPTIAYRQTCP